MRFITHGHTNHQTLMLIHGMGNTSSLFDPILEYLKDYYVVVCELDGHSPNEESEFSTVADACEKIEGYVTKEFGGCLNCLLGFSLGGTIATELISRGKINIEHTIIDAGFNVKMGIMTYPYKWVFQGAIGRLKKGKRIPTFLTEAMMGKGNSRIIDTLYKGVSLQTIGNVSLSVYRYEMKDSIRNYKNPVVFWHGSNEFYPPKSAKLLKKYLPNMQIQVFENMGHGQMMTEHPKEYVQKINQFIKTTQ